jgi:hypothetical protein
MPPPSSGPDVRHSSNLQHREERKDALGALHPRSRQVEQAACQAVEARRRPSRAGRLTTRKCADREKRRSRASTSAGREAGLPRRFSTMTGPRRVCRPPSAHTSPWGGSCRLTASSASRLCGFACVPCRATLRPGRGGGTADAGDLKSPGLQPMWVRPPPPALFGLRCCERKPCSIAQALLCRPMGIERIRWASLPRPPSRLEPSRLTAGRRCSKARRARRARTAAA